jgi:hypothetical protein
MDARNFFLTLRQLPLQMVTGNGFSVATKGTHVICFWKALHPHHRMAIEIFWSPQGLVIEKIWSPYPMVTKFFFKCHKVW